VKIRAALALALLVTIAFVTVTYLEWTDQAMAQLPILSQTLAYGGEVVYLARAAKTGKLDDATPATTNSTTLVEIDPEMRTTVVTRAAAHFSVMLCIELAEQGADVIPAGIQTRVDGARMVPSTSQPNYSGGYVTQPLNGAPVGDAGKVRTFCYSWESGGLAAGSHTVSFYWAVRGSSATLWARMYNVSVWAVAVK
jgi:hypothetical protein